MITPVSAPPPARSPAACHRADGRSRDGCGIVVGYAELGAHQAGAIGEQFTRLAGQRERRDPPRQLRLPPRSAHGSWSTSSRPGCARTAAISAAHESSRCSQLSSTINMSARTGNGRSCPSTSDRAGREGPTRRPLPPVRVGIGDRREVYVPDVVAKLAGGADARRVLPDTAGAGEGHQTVVGEEPTHLDDLCRTPDETGQLRRKALRNSAFAVRNGGNSLRISGWHSCTTRSGRGSPRNACEPRSVSHASPGR